MPVQPGGVEQRKSSPAGHRPCRVGHAAQEIWLITGPRRQTALGGPHHQRQPRRGQRQAGHQRRPAQSQGFAQQHDPQRNRADDQRGHLGAGVADGQHQQPVVAGEAEHAQGQRPAHLGHRGPAPAPGHQQEHQRGHRAIRQETAGRQIHRRQSRRHARRHEHQPPQRTREQSRDDAPGHSEAAGPPQGDCGTLGGQRNTRSGKRGGHIHTPKPSSAAITAPLMKWLWSLASISSRPSRSCGRPTRLRGSIWMSFWPCSVCQWW